MKDKVRWLLETVKRKKGQGLVEYSLIVTLVAIASVIILGAIGKDVFNFISNVAGKFEVLNNW